MPIREGWKKQYRMIYDILFKTPRVPMTNIKKIAGKTAGRRLKEALTLLYIAGPELRKRSFENLREYVYFLNCKDPDESFLRYRENLDVIYHAQMLGFCNMWIISKKKMDIDEDVILEGCRSDYHFSYTPNHSWETTLKRMRRRIETFDPGTYLKKNIIETHFDETVEWDEQDEILYRHFKYNLRNSLQPLKKDYRITGWKIYEFLNRLPETCTIGIGYYPEMLLTYDNYLFMLETDYEDFIIDLFSEFPTTTSFFKVSNKLFVFIHVLKKFMKNIESQKNVEDWYIPLIMVELSKKRIVKDKRQAIIGYSKGKEF